MSRSRTPLTAGLSSQRSSHTCYCLALLVLLLTAGAAVAMPANDSCSAAGPIAFGTTMVNLLQASLDGAASCDEEVVGDLPGLRDVWFRFTPGMDGPITLYVVDERDAPVSVAAYGGCPGTLLNEIRCSSGTGLVLDATAGESILLRLAAPDTDPVLFSVIVEPAARIGGRVLERNGLTPAVPSEVEVVNAQGQRVGSTAAAADGSFAFTVPRPGTYFATANSQVYRAEIFDDVPCDILPCDPTTGAPIDVAAAAQLDDIDFRLDTLPQISGTVTDRDSGQPVADVAMSAFDAEGAEVTTTTDEDGQYTFVGLRPQTYTVVAYDDDYMRTIYDGLPCPRTTCSPSQGTPLPLELNEHRQGIDFELQGLGRIAGRVSAADTGAPIFLASVEAHGDQGFVAGTLTNEVGEYTLGGLPADSYTVLVDPYDVPYIPQLFAGIPCPLRDCDRSTGTPVPVALNATTDRVDFALERGGTIRGTVRSRPTGDGVADAFLFLLDLDGRIVADAISGGIQSGRYTIDGIAPGEYVLLAFSRFHQGRVVGGAPCSRDFSDCDLATGTRWTLDVGSEISGVDPVLDRFGVITGRLLDDATEASLTQGVVKAWDAQGHLAATDLSPENGTFRLQGLVPGGSYTVSAEHVGYRTDVYPGVPQPPCINGVCDPTIGEPIPLELNETVDIDLRLRRKAYIAGTVRADDGAFVPYPRLQLWSRQGDLLQSFEGDADGRFIVEGLDGGDYLLSTDLAEAGYRDEVYEDHPCGGTCSPLNGTVLSVGEFGTISDVDVVLTRQGVVSGDVADSLWDIPIYRASVVLYDAAGSRLRSTVGNFEGRFEFVGLEPGTYYAVAGAYGFPETLFPNIPCPQGHCDLTSGTALVIEDNVIIEDVSFDLAMQQGITGTVIDEATGLPIIGAQVQIHDGSGFIEATSTNAQGNYRVPLELGTYYLKLDYVGANFDGEEEAYDDVICPRLICDPRDVGVPVEVGDNQVVDAIDFAVTGQFCNPNNFTLCLNDQRFRVRANFRNPSSFLSFGRARPLTDDSGTFYFFGPDNLEIIVKVLNACVEPFQHFWVYSAGLTDLEVELIVEDSYTGLSRTYRTLGGQPFPLIRDTTAFATCDVPAMGSTTAGSASYDVETLHALLDGSLAEVAGDELLNRQGATASDSTVSGGCTPSDTALCLQRGRFRVEAQWVDSDGRSGIAQADPVTADTGTFWFFAEDNVEVMIKVLDVCVEPFDSFWVFAAGLTDVEVTLNVTDTLTDEVRQYVNDQGMAFVPIQDTAAFRTCP